MFKEPKDGYYLSSKLSRSGDLIHGFATKKFGDLRANYSPANYKKTQNFLKLLGLKAENLILMQQVHGCRSLLVEHHQKGKVIPGIDGMITTEKQIVLGVGTADCLPVLLYGPEKKIIAIAHAGWKGVLGGIVATLVKKIIRLGVKPENIIVAIGPHIGPCCYYIWPERAPLFRKKFGDLPGMITKRENKFYLDLAIPVLFQLENAGVKKGNIDISYDCTFHQSARYYSFRRDGKITGEMLSVISLNN